MIDLNEIKPKVKSKSDKYSWNLYRFLNKLFKDKDEGKYIQKRLEIHWLHSSRLDGSYLEFNPDDLNIVQMIILPTGKGNSGSFYSMASILREGRAERFALPFKWEKEMTNITDCFFDTYKRDGRCIFDRKHIGWMLGTEDRFTYVNNTRKCNWCNEWQHKEIVKEQSIKRNEVWVAQ